MTTNATKHEPGTLEALAELISARVQKTRPSKPLLRVINTPKPTIFDSITRDCIYRRIRFLRNAYGLHFLIDQATFNLPNMECLEDADLSRLLDDMEKARECIAEGIPLEDRDLIVRSDIPGWSP